MTDRLKALEELGAATVHEAQGKRGALSSMVKPVDPRMKLCGPALTVRTVPADNLAIHHALLQARPGDVLVVDADAHLEAGAWGDILSAAAVKRGIAGLVINGAVRDVESIADMGFPVFAKAVSIKGTAKTDPGRIGEAIRIDGVDIHNGDVVLGDRDGVVVVAAAEVEAVHEAARQRERTEREYLRRISAGESTVDILNLR